MEDGVSDTIRPRLEAAGGEMAARRITDMAKDVGIKPQTLRRAREDLGVVIRREDYGVSGWSVWTLPVMPPATRE